MSILKRLTDLARAPFRVADRSDVSDLDTRLETVRSELSYELRYRWGRRARINVAPNLRPNRC
jgi:hypothetical protein